MKRTLFLIALFAWGGCSSTSFVGKRVDNFTAYYSTFYNARTAYDTAEKALEQPDKAIDRDTYLFVFEPGSPGAGVKDFESAIKKSADVLRGHPNSKWVDDALLLIGKSYYYMGNTVGAQQKFREVIDRQSSLEDEARFWLGLALMSAGSFDEAGAHLQESLDRDKVSKKWLARMRLALGEMYVRQERWEEAAEQLKAGVDRADDRELSSRGQFLLGQVYETIGMFDLASRAYRDVSRFKPIYELEYAARFSAVRVEGEHGVPEDALQSLRKMERDGKNFTNRAELAYLRGRILMADQRSQDAYDTWYDVLYNSDGNISSIRGQTHYHLGLLFRDQFIDFDRAAAHFDTASTSLSRGTRSNAAGRTERLASSPSAITDAAELADVFGTFASFHADVQHFDSLLTLGSLDDEAFRDRIEEIRRQRAAEIVEERRSQERRAAEASFRRTGADVGSAGVPRTGAAGGSADYATAGFLYHRDRSRVQDGLLGFFDRWGERPAVPNWRRRAAITEGRGPGTAEADPESGAPTIPVGTVTGDVTTDALLRSVDVDISEIPRSAEAQAQMRLRRAGSRYELANTLFLSMARPDSAAAWYRLVFEESEDAEISARALYALGEVQRATGDRESADAIYADVLERYPDSEVASRAAQRLGLESAVASVAEADILNDMYRAAFEQWVDGSFDDGMRGMLALAAAYPDSLLSGRSLLAAGAIYSDWAEIERVDITQPIAIEIPDSLWI
ncbi:MAG: tetratricopeptide repeat protein, partial [Rhodothermales bacterium]|nr:tetratricopeptide repeat protein [Rhodothermales bacterium]